MFFLGGVRSPFEKIWAPGMMCMPVKDLGRVSSYWGKKERETVCNVSWSFFLPARFDWSIMGCTILLLALMNLAKRREKTEEKNKR